MRVNFSLLQCDAKIFGKYSGCSGHFYKMWYDASTNTEYLILCLLDILSLCKESVGRAVDL